MGKAHQAQGKAQHGAPEPARKRHGHWQRWLAVLFSSTVFFLVSCTAVTKVGMEVLSRDQAKVGAPPWHTVKLVLATPDGQLQLVNWEPAVPRNLALQRASPLLPNESGALEVGDTKVSFEAQPDGPNAQIVEVTVRDPEVPSFFRYRVQLDEARRAGQALAPAPASAAAGCSATMPPAAPAASPCAA